jgi:nitroimidazol reductase NimA-like FMN-containing flavoprotein (pyridoxamine 5'-phosphate oxidase superfamily)
MNVDDLGEVPQSSRHFRDLTRSECEKLLQEHVVGRVGFCGAAGPLILPVNYRVQTGQVVFRTSAYGMLSELRRRTPVAFEIDGINEPGETGWDVLACGTAEAVMHDHLLTELWGSGPIPWAKGTRNLFIAITLTSLTGRVVRGPFAD